jgi:hypothetical protein
VAGVVGGRSKDEDKDDDDVDEEVAVVKVADGRSSLLECGEAVVACTTTACTAGNELTTSTFRLFVVYANVLLLFTTNS